MDKFAAFLLHFGTPFSNGKNEVTGQMKQAVMAVTDYSKDVDFASRRQ